MNNFINQTSIKAIIFDCDGTLVDSEGSHIAAWELVTLESGKELDIEDRLQFVGKPDTIIAKALIEHLDNHTIEALLNKKNRYFVNFLKEGFPPITGTVNFLQQLINYKEQLGIKLAVASAASKHEILINLKNLGLENAFDVILSGENDLDTYRDEEGVNKPKPYIYLKAAELLGVLPSECVAIEDSFSGVSAASAAGCITIAIPTQLSQHHDLSKATYLLDSLANVSVSDFFAMVNRQP